MVRNSTTLILIVLQSCTIVTAVRPCSGPFFTSFVPLSVAGVIAINSHENYFPPSLQLGGGGGDDDLIGAPSPSRHPIVPPAGNILGKQDDELVEACLDVNILHTL